jgi:hypothetical protein
MSNYDWIMHLYLFCIVLSVIRVFGRKANKHYYYYYYHYFSCCEQLNSCDQNVNRCCEIIELNNKIQSQLFKLLSLTAAEGVYYIFEI